MKIATAAAVASLLIAGVLAPNSLWADLMIAHRARTLAVHDEGALHFVRSSGSQVIDEGTMRGTLPGRARVTFTYNGGPTVRARFTIYGRGFTLNGYGTGRLKNPNSATPSFRGSLTLTGARGRYAHAHGSGELFGVFNRRTYALTVQALGTLHY
jgi:hypothetical protein